LIIFAFPKTISLWLRHRPDAVGLVLDEQGDRCRRLLSALLEAGLVCGWQDLLLLVEESDKQRFELSPDATRIRARQGHSVPVVLDWPQATPPDLLYHGTVERFLPAILSEGLPPMGRHHVHLSPDLDTAVKVEARRGQPIVLRVKASDMARAGYRFQLTSNRVWHPAWPPLYVRWITRPTP
jgi:putative RNA 2'-phosphotransferase